MQNNGISDSWSSENKLINAISSTIYSKKARGIIVGIVVLLYAAIIMAFPIEYSATKDVREAEKVLSEIEVALDECRAGKTEFPFIHYSRVEENEYFRSALANLAMELYQNQEYVLLEMLIKDLETEPKLQYMVESQFPDDWKWEVERN